MLPRLSSEYSQSPDAVAFFAALKSAGFDGDIESNYGSRLVMSTDNSVYQQVPEGILYPKTVSALQLIGRIASKPAFQQVRFAARGGGTGTNGQSLTPGIVVDLSRHMNGILELNLEQSWVRVQAGVVKDQLNSYLKPYGLFFAPDLSTSNRATIGGMVNTDASGQGSLVYGKTSDHVLGLTSVLADGSLLETKPVSHDELELLCQRQDSVGAVYRQAKATCYDQRKLILSKFPRLNRFLTGYDLEHVVDETQERFDLSRLITGSEGSLAYVAEAKLSLLPLPKYRALVNVKYDTFDAALRHAPCLVAAKATAVETIDSKVLDLARQDIVWHSVSDLLHDVPGKPFLGLNLVEFTDDDLESLQQRVDTLCEQLSDSQQAGNGVIGHQVTFDADGIGKIWGMRKKAVGLLGATEGRAKPVAFAEDTAVPPEHLADFIAEFRQLLDSHGLHYGMFGHVDAGVLHVRPALDLCDPEQEVMLRNISDHVVALVAKYGGLMWGEHGKGYRSEYGPEFFGEQLFLELRRIKTAFDPNNRMNPGKICTPLDSQEALVSVDAQKRAYFERQIPVNVRDDFAGAMNCNGNGLCFNFDASSPMCPSFRSTGDRRFSPKGRATLMREWLRQLAEQGYAPGAQPDSSTWHSVLSLPRRISNSWRARRGEYDYSHEVYQAMQTCLACKACASQCPIKIDVPEFRSRFLTEYYQRYLRPLRDYLVATTELSLPLLSRVPQLYNWPLSQPWGQWLMSRLVGMEDAPLLSTPTLRQRLQSGDTTPFSLDRLSQLSEQQRLETVLIVQDPFTSYNEAELVHDWILLLKRLGFQPVLLPFKPNGKPAHVKGFLSQFAQTAKTSAQFLQKLADLQLPLVGVDPALVLCYRDEYQQTLGAVRGDFVVQLPQEFLAMHISRLQANASQQAAEPYKLLGHCTEKTLLPGSEAQWQTVFAAAGLTLEPVAVGCCGMAGTYGHETAHKENSKQIYQLSWQPALEQSSPQQVLVTGYSCRSQVKRMAGSKPRHPLQALLAELSD